MGLEQTVTFARGAIPAWAVVGDLLARRGFPVHVRMIDGELALPDEEPPEGWRELRLGTPQGMVTVRRDGARLAFVTWGNADDAMRQAWNALVWAFAAVGSGQIETSQGMLDASTYRERMEMPSALRG